MFPNMQKCAYRHSKIWWKEIFSITAIHITANDERHMQEGKIGDPHLEFSRPDLRINEIQTLQHSRKDLSNGLWAWKKCRFTFWESTWVLQPKSREQCFFTFNTNVERRRDSLWTRKLPFTWWANVSWLEKTSKRFKSRRIHLLLWLQMEPLIRRSNNLCRWFGHACSSSIMERIARDAVAAWTVRRDRLLVWMVSRSAMVSHREWEKKRL